MKKLSLKVLGLAMITAIGGLAIGQNANDAVTLKEISGYRQWTRLKQTPVIVDMPAKSDPADVSL